VIEEGASRFKIVDVNARMPVPKLVKNGFKSGSA
jgi:hypothetical protein